MIFLMRYEVRVGLGIWWVDELWKKGWLLNGMIIVFGGLLIVLSTVVKVAKIGMVKNMWVYLVFVMFDIVYQIWECFEY